MMRSEISAHPSHAYFNTCMLSNLFFGCGIVELQERKIKELKKTHELPMLRKLGLGKYFPRKLLHMKNPALGVGLIEPSEVIDLLAIKFYAGNKRMKCTFDKVIGVHEEIGFKDSKLKTVERRNNEGKTYWKKSR